MITENIITIDPVVLIGAVAIFFLLLWAMVRDHKDSLDRQEQNETTEK